MNRDVANSKKSAIFNSHHEKPIYPRIDIFIYQIASLHDGKKM